MSTHQTPGSHRTSDLTKFRLLPATGMLLATLLTIAACSSGTVSPPAAAPGTPHALAPAGSSSTPANPASGQAPSPTPPASASAEPAGFTSALAAWRSAAAAPAATRNSYLQQAAQDLQASGNSGYETAIAELTDLAQLPATNDTSAQQASAHSDVQSLDSFFGTPGLLT